MALDRTWYNSLVDDDGSGLTGSVWDKADVDALMDAVDAELVKPTCWVYMAAAQSVPNGVWTNINYSGVNYATPASMWTAGNPSQVVAPSAGLYLVIGTVVWVGHNAGIRALRITVNGGYNALPDLRFSANQNDIHPQQISGIVLLQPGHTVGLQGWQSSGAALNASGMAYPTSNVLQVSKLA